VARLAWREGFDEPFLASVAASLGRLVREGLGLLEEQS
jgi:hypothetical protein